MLLGTSIDVPECSKTTFGCCWNKKDVKNNAAGSNCPRMYWVEIYREMFNL